MGQGQVTFGLVLRAEASVRGPEMGLGLEIKTWGVEWGRKQGIREMVKSVQPTSRWLALEEVQE